MRRLIYRSLPVFIIILAITASMPLVLPKIENKYYDITKRLRLLEERVKSISHVQSVEIIKYQRDRGTFDLRSSLDVFSTGGEWRRLDVPWNKEEHLKTKAIKSDGETLFVGLLGTRPGGAKIYSYNGEDWNKIAGKSIIPEWSKYKYITDIEFNGSSLFASVDNSVWRYTDKNWEKVGSGNTLRPWSNSQLAYTLQVHSGTLYLGMTGEKPEVYKLEEDVWINVSAGLPKQISHGVYELHSHVDGELYATVSPDTGSTFVYRFNDKAQKWVRIGGNGVNGSWKSDGFWYGLSMTSHMGYLVISMSRHPQTTGDFSTVWAFDGNEWKPVGMETPHLWGEMNNFNAVYSFEGALLVGGGGHPAGNASIWALDTPKWQLVGGRGTSKSWGKDFPHTLTGDFRNTAAEYPYRLEQWGELLVAGFGDAPGAAQVWVFEPFAESGS